MGASTAGFSGVIFSGLQGFVSPESFVLLESITILAMVVLGGMGSIPGVVLGALLLVVVPEVIREYAQYRLTIFGLGLTLMMLVRPEGLWPVRVRTPDDRLMVLEVNSNPSWRGLQSVSDVNIADAIAEDFLHTVIEHRGPQAEARQAAQNQPCLA